MVVHPPTVAPKLPSQEHVREGNDHEEHDKVEQFAHDKLPKVGVVVMQNSLEGLCILTSHQFTVFVGKQVSFGLEAKFFHFSTLEVPPKFPRQPK